MEKKFACVFLFKPDTYTEHWGHKAATKTCQWNKTLRISFHCTSWKTLQTKTFCKGIWNGKSVQQNAKSREHMSSANWIATNKDRIFYQNVKKNSKSIRFKILFKGIWKGKSNQQKRKFLAKAKYSCKSIIFEKEFENEKATSKTQRAESTCHLLNGPSNVFDVCSDFFFWAHIKDIGRSIEQMTCA